MKHLLQLEELALMIAPLVGIYYLPVHVAWWLYPFIFLAPDLSMLGYLINPRAGAITYNFVHHKALAIAIIIAGFISSSPWLTFTGLILLSHSSFDRVLGYGLKYPDAFEHTHLGMIGKAKKAGNWSPALIFFNHKIAPLA